MRAWFSALAGRARAGRAPFLLAGVVVLLPAVLLAALGVRTLAQDARLAEAQARERLDRAAARTAQEFERGLGRWDEAVALLGAEAPGSADAPPPIIATILGDGPDAVLVRIESRRWTVIPAGRLLYTFEPLSAASFHAAEAPKALEAADVLEIQKQDYVKAAEAYRALLQSSDAAMRPLLLQRLARTEAKAGRRDEALRLYEALERETGAMIGNLPADLIACVQRCELIAGSGSAAERLRAASALYRSLVSGRWLLEKPRHLYYSTQARTWLAEASGSDRQAIDSLEATEREKARLAEAVGDISGTIRLPGASSAGHRLFTIDGVQHMAFWRSTPARKSTTLLVVGEANLRSRVWPALLSPPGPDDFSVSLVAPDGAEVFATVGHPVTTQASMVREQTFQDDDVLWRVRVTPRSADALYAQVVRRRWLYLGMLVVMVGGLLAASLAVGRALKREVEVARLKSRFVSAVSHEFRSPLTGISQLSELLVGGKVADDARRWQYYELIHSESRRLSRLVEQVLDFARMEDGRQEYRLERVDTSAWLRSVTDEFRRTPASRGKTIAASVADGLPPLEVDAQAMAGAIHNLLDNAVKYSPGRNTVWLDASATPGGERVAISVRDEGVGVPPDEQRHVFDRFFRGAELAETVAGTGLGLSLVKHVVSAHGGVVSVASTPGRGTTFTVVLPAERER